MSGGVLMSTLPGQRGTSQTLKSPACSDHQIVLLSATRNGKHRVSKAQTSRHHNRQQPTCCAVAHEFSSLSSDLAADLSADVTVDSLIQVDVPSTSGRSIDADELLRRGVVTAEELCEAGLITQRKLYNLKIKGALVIQDLSEVIYAYGDEFDNVNTTHALNKLAKMYRVCCSERSAAPPDSNLHHLHMEYIKPCMRMLVELTMRHLHVFEPWDVASSFWSFAVLGYQDERVLSVLLQKAEGLLPEFKPTDVSNLFWAFAKLNIQQHGVLERLQPVCLARLVEFKAEELASVVWACGKLQFNPGVEFLDAVAEEASKRLYQFHGRELANIMWGFARLRHLHRPLTSALSRHLPEIWSHMPAVDVSMMLWAFARLRFKPRAVLADLPDHLMYRLDAFKPQDLTSLVYSYAVLEFLHPALLNRVAVAASRCLADFSTLELVNLVWAYGRFGVHPQDITFITHLATRLHADRHVLSSQGLASTVKAFARLRFKNEAWLNDFARVVESKMSEFTPDQLSCVLWGYSWLQHYDAQLFSTSLRRMQEMISQWWRYKVYNVHVSSVVQSCERLGFCPLAFADFAEANRLRVLTQSQYEEYRKVPSTKVVPPRFEEEEELPLVGSPNTPQRLAPLDEASPMPPPHEHTAAVSWPAPPPASSTAHIPPHLSLICSAALPFTTSGDGDIDLPSFGTPSTVRPINVAYVSRANGHPHHPTTSPPPCCCSEPSSPLDHTQQPSASLADGPHCVHTSTTPPNPHTDSPAVALNHTPHPELDPELDPSFPPNPPHLDIPHIALHSLPHPDEMLTIHTLSHPDQDVSAHTTTSPPHPGLSHPPPLLANSSVVAPTRAHPADRGSQLKPRPSFPMLTLVTATNRPPRPLVPRSTAE